MKIKKGDKIKIVSGKDRGKTGSVIKVFPKENKIVVEGVNLYKKRVRPKSQGQKGEIVSIARPLPSSRTALICSSCKETTRTGYRFEGERKIRYCKKCGAVN